MGGANFLDTSFTLTGFIDKTAGGDFAGGETVVCILTGHGLKDPSRAVAVCSEPETVAVIGASRTPGRKPRSARPMLQTTST